MTGGMYGRLKADSGIVSRTEHGIGGIMSNTGRYTGASSSGRGRGSAFDRIPGQAGGSSTMRRTSASAGGASTGRRSSSQAGGVSAGGKASAQSAASRKNSSKAKANPKKQKKTRRKKKHPRLRLALKIFFLLFLLAILVALSVFYFKYGNTLLGWQAEAKRIVNESTEDTFKSSEASFVYDSKGKVLAKLKGEKESYYLTYDQIPQYVKDAFVITEDRDFFEHSGYDLKALVSAGVTLIRNKMKGEDASRGASTITQQLARTIFTDYLDYLDKSYSRKIKEIFVAMELEKKYSKEQILEFYINNVYFSNGYYGIEAASRGFFSKSVSDMTLAETAFVCSIPNRPQSYDPFEHFDNTNKRKGRILDQMLSGDCISAAEYSDAAYQDIVLNPPEDIKSQDYLSSYAVSCATKALMAKQGFEFRYEFNSDAERASYDEEYGEVYDECHKALYASGYQIYTSLNKRIQKKLQNAVDQQLASFTEKKKKVYALQGAATCINNETGRVVAIVGGRKQKNAASSTLNRGFLSFRQPGSSFKPIAVYTPQIERGYTPDTIVDDTFFEGGPRNSDGNYLGKIPLRTAVEKSKNVVAWRLFEELTPAVGLSYVMKMNFSKIVDNDYYPASSLGGLTNGVSTVEMASAYATLANNGSFRNPTCIKKITDSNGKVIVNDNKLTRTKEIYKPNAAYTMTDILQGVLVRGTAAGKGLTNMACAGKTGTTSDKKDGWFCGYTPYYSTAVWVGYDTPRTLSNLYGSTYPLSIWRQFMEELHSGLEYKSFTKPTDGSEGDELDPDEGKEMDETPEPEETIDPEVIKKEDVTTEFTPKPTKKADTGEGQDNAVHTKKPVIKPTEKPVDDGDYEDVGDDTTQEDVGEEMN